MASNPSVPPPKPWEQAGSSSGPTPFKPPTPGSTSDVVEASGTAQPGEIVSTANRNSGAVNTNALGRPVPPRPWEQQQTYGSTYGGYNSGMNYNSGYGSSMYGGGSYGGLGGSYGGGMYGNSMYRGGVGGMYGGSSMYGGGMYGGGLGGGLGGTMGGYGMGMGMGGGMGMGPYGNQDPNNPFGPPSSPPGFWISFLRVLEGAVNFFGRIAVLIDQNTQAFHLFITAMLQLFDRSGLLYGELARFVFRLMGIRTTPRKVQPPGSEIGPGPHGQNMGPGPHGPQNYIEGPKVAPSGGWDNVWGNGPDS